MSDETRLDQTKLVSCYGFLAERVAVVVIVVVAAAAAAPVSQTSGGDVVQPRRSVIPALAPQARCYAFPFSSSMLIVVNRTIPIPNPQSSIPIVCVLFYLQRR